MNDTDIENVIELINSSMEKGTGRLCLDISGSRQSRTEYHHGRCDVGSPWAKGTVPNSDANDTTDNE